MSYVEAGYVISILSNAKETLNGPYATSGITDISNQFSTKYGGFVRGFGSYIWGQDNFGISAGLRIRYDLNDAFNESVKYQYSPNYATDTEITGNTNPFSLMLTLEFNYDLGFYMAKSPCNGRRTLLIGNGGGKR